MSDRQMPPALRFMLAARRCELQQLEGLALTCELVEGASALVHDLQRERGFSNILLGTGNDRYRTALEQHSTTARGSEARLRDWLEALDASVAQDRPRLLNRIACVLHLLDGLPSLRRAIVERRVAMQAATTAFSHLIAGLLTVIFEAADTASDPGLTRALVALFNFMQGKELAGQARATGVVGFTQGHFDASLLARLDDLYSSQSRCFEGFLDHADAEALQRWDEVQRCPSRLQIERLREVARRTSANAQVEPALAELWFELNTRRLDAMQTVAQHLVAELRTRCAASIGTAQADLDSHRKLSRRLAELERDPGQPLLFSLAAQPVGETRPGEPAPGILDLLHAQTRRLHEVEAELQETRQSLAERKLLERAKQRLMQQLALPEAEAHQHLQQLAMHSGLPLPEVVRQVLAQPR
ncbi:transcription antitermination regulator [Pseudomonas oryzihabitans]|nr:transcription antitermination regulator [Pseudomonas psychrotolerans]KTT37082.1 transcription antitermination regulator [Pseudomonas psychrotolerans]KTT44396.1 transcription antitermination regulator [Pseudomonas psychrotolerans]KTT64231.1 transcription antitermination regulator [Pseudomonas psychrotolerans]